MESDPIKIEVVIPVHNRRETTLQALKSLSGIDTSGLEMHVIIVDDGSSDGTSDAVAERFPNVQIVQGDGTLHYAAGTNRGISAALDRMPDYIVACNDDSIFHPQAFQRLVRTAQATSRSIVGAMLLLWDQPHLAFQIGFTWKSLRGGWVQIDGTSVFDLPREAFTVDGLAGNCVLIPVEAIKECGLMDEDRFPHGWGDIQYFVRMRKNGWRLLVEPLAYVWCEPNTNPPPLHSLGTRHVITTLFKNRKHPLNLHRQFIARWESAPTKLHAAVAYGVFLASLATKTIKYAFDGKRFSAGQAP